MAMKKHQILYAAIIIFIFGLYTKTEPPGSILPISEHTSEGHLVIREKKDEIPTKRVSSQETQMNEIMKNVIKLQDRIDVLSENIQEQAAQAKQFQQQQQHNIMMPKPIAPRKSNEERMKEFAKNAVIAKQELLQKHNYSSDYINDKLVSSKGKRVKIIMLVGSTARSGTSFLGELLSQFDSFLYLFEPELYLRVATNEMVTEQYGVPHLRDMINCHFTDNFIAWLKTRASPYNCFRHPVTKTGCTSWDLCLTIPKLTEACMQEDIRIMKVGLKFV